MASEKDFTKRKVQFKTLKRVNVVVPKILPMEERLVEDSVKELCDELAVRASYDLGFFSLKEPRKPLKFRCIEDEIKNAPKYEFAHSKNIQKETKKPEPKPIINLA